MADNTKVLVNFPEGEHEFDSSAIGKLFAHDTLAGEIEEVGQIGNLYIPYHAVEVAIIKRSITSDSKTDVNCEDSPAKWHYTNGFGDDMTCHSFKDGDSINIVGACNTTIWYGDGTDAISGTSSDQIIWVSITNDETVCGVHVRNGLILMAGQNNANANCTFTHGSETATVSVTIELKCDD